MFFIYSQWYGGRFCVDHASLNFFTFSTSSSGHGHPDCHHQDNLVESTEYLDGVLTLNTTDEAINLQPLEALISIIDNDGTH